jgi:DNA processing protein
MKNQRRCEGGRISKPIIKKMTPDDLMGPLNDIEKKFAPPYLYFKGNRKLINSCPRVSIIGSRRPSKRGINNTHMLTKFFVMNKVIIVSGLAMGIDSVAHKTAIDNEGSTIAVLGTPLDKYYPKQNSDLQDKIAKDHLVISQFPIGSPIQRKNFPLRNRTMALLSHASIIVEAGEGSGTIHQGWEALRLGRPLFIVEDIIKNKNLKWPAKLIEYGAEILPISKVKIVLESLPAPRHEVENYVTF